MGYNIGKASQYLKRAKNLSLELGSSFLTAKILKKETWIISCYFVVVVVVF